MDNIVYALADSISPCWFKPTNPDNIFDLVLLSRKGGCRIAQIASQITSIKGIKMDVLLANI
jgi:hypothetical protein